MVIDKSNEEDEKISELNRQRYKKRLGYLKRAQEFSQQNDIPKSVENYSIYLNILASYFDVPETDLSPKLFDQEKEIAEMLLISQVYWDLAKAYDRSPTLQLEAVKCLQQFVKFSIGYKYQYVNAQMVRKFIKKKKAHNKRLFQETYEKIRVTSKACFIATYSFGEKHQVTNDLRKFKNNIVGSKGGNLFIDTYYKYSPKIVTLLESNPKFGKYSNKLIIRPMLKMVVKITNKI